MQTDVRRDGAFFGRRKGKKLRRHQTDLLGTLLPRLALQLSAAPPVTLQSLFTNAPEIVRLEIGFGGAEHLIAQAQSAPGEGFIGIEPFVNGMAKALSAINANAIENIRLHHGDAVDVLAWLPQASIGRVDLLYPDPWPKRRHHKRRFVQEKNLDAIGRILKTGGEFRFATDIADYAAWTLSRVMRRPDFVWTAECASDWREPWSGFAGTRYEAKAKKEGRAPCYLRFRKI